MDNRLIDFAENYKDIERISFTNVEDRIYISIIPTIRKIHVSNDSNNIPRYKIVTKRLFIDSYELTRSCDKLNAICNEAEKSIKK